MKTEARNLKDRFEHAGGEEAEELKEKQKRLEEEFVRLRGMEISIESVQLNNFRRA